MFRLATPDTKRKIDNYRRDCLVRYRRMEKNHNGSIAWESNKAVTMMQIDETTNTLVRQSLENIDSIVNYLVERAAKRMFAEEVMTLL